MCTAQAVSFYGAWYNKDMSEPIDIIKPLMESSIMLERIFTRGDCYKFHLFLKAIYPLAVPLLNKRITHVITKIGDTCYDITGETSGIDYLPMSEKEVELANTWGFDIENGYLADMVTPISELDPMDDECYSMVWGEYE